MYATLGRDLPRGSKWTREPRCDSMRLLAEATLRGARLVSSTGKEKSDHFPKVRGALRDLAGSVRRTLVLDGENVERVRVSAQHGKVEHHWSHNRITNALL